MARWMTGSIAVRTSIRLVDGELRRVQHMPAHRCVLRADRDGQISEQEMRIGLSHMVVRCPNSRCCYRTRGDCLATAGATNAAATPVSFCSFRQRFLLLPSDNLWEEYWLAAGHPGCCDVGQPIRFADPQRKRGASPWGHLLAGAMAGATSRTATAPLETLRIMAMTGALPPVAAGARGGGLAAAAGALVRSHGWGALYRGNMANVVRSAPQKGLDFLAFDVFKSALAARPAAGAATVQTASISSTTGRGVRRGGGGGAAVQPGTAATLAAAGLAGAVSNAVLYPLEVVRTRLSTDSSGAYRGVGQAFNVIRRTEGVSALYRCDTLRSLRAPRWQQAYHRLTPSGGCRGLVPSVAAILPEAAITYGLFDILKRSFTRWSGREEAGVLPSLSAGVLAAFMGQVVAYPLETVSRRMQARSHPPPFCCSDGMSASCCRARGDACTRADRKGRWPEQHVCSGGGDCARRRPAGAVPWSACRLRARGAHGGGVVRHVRVCEAAVHAH